MDVVHCYSERKMKDALWMRTKQRTISCDYWQIYALLPCLHGEFTEFTVICAITFDEGSFGLVFACTSG